MALQLPAQTWVRVNLAGYLPDDCKVAVLISQESVEGGFVVFDAMTDRQVNIPRATVSTAKSKCVSPSSIGPPSKISG